jgi:hypothetical protein
MPTTYANLEREVRSLQQQRFLLFAVIINLLDGVKDHDLESETGLPKEDCDIIREIKCRALIAGVTADQPLRTFLQ